MGEGESSAVVSAIGRWFLPSDGRGRNVGSRLGNRRLVRGSWSQCMREGERWLPMNRTLLDREGTLTPALSHPMGEGEMSAVVWAIGGWSAVQGPDACANEKSRSR